MGGRKWSGNRMLDFLKTQCPLTVATREIRANKILFMVIAVHDQQTTTVKGGKNEKFLKNYGSGCLYPFYGGGTAGLSR